MSGQAQLILVIAGMHLLGLACAAALLVPALRSGERPPKHGHDGDDGRGNKPTPPQSQPTGPGGGVPIPDAMPAGVRLRGHERLADLRPRPERRPAREPERRPEREPVRSPQ